jgi:hypothetical protein
MAIGPLDALFGKRVAAVEICDSAGFDRRSPVGLVIADLLVDGAKQYSAGLRRLGHRPGDDFELVMLSALDAGNNPTALQRASRELKLSQAETGELLHSICAAALQLYQARSPAPPALPHAPPDQSNADLSAISDALDQIFRDSFDALYNILGVSSSGREEELAYFCANILTYSLTISQQSHRFGNINGIKTDFCGRIPDLIADQYEISRELVIKLLNERYSEYEPLLRQSFLEMGDLFAGQETYIALHRNLGRAAGSTIGTWSPVDGVHFQGAVVVAAAAVKDATR